MAVVLKEDISVVVVSDEAELEEKKNVFQVIIQSNSVELS